MILLYVQQNSTGRPVEQKIWRIVSNLHSNLEVMQKMSLQQKSNFAIMCLFFQVYNLSLKTNICHQVFFFAKKEQFFSVKMKHVGKKTYPVTLLSLHCIESSPNPLIIDTFPRRIIPFLLHSALKILKQCNLGIRDLGKAKIYEFFY